ncbi:MAG: S41 family peptidase [Actinobacteria bacterium]|nr:S41 family peptidase [Actinomycetota bacterium]
MRVTIVILALVAALAAGVYVGANPNTPVVGVLKDVIAPDKTEISSEQAKQLIENEFYRKVDGEKLTDGELSGMVKSLKDPYSHYFNPDQNKAFAQSISGKYSGVGMAVNQHDKGLLVTFVYDGSPAKQAGIRREDVITAVDGKSIAGQSSDASVARIKGPEGTYVTLTARRPKRQGGEALGAERDYRLQRKQIEIPVALGKLYKRDGRKIGVVMLAGFTETAGVAVAREIEKLEKRGADSYVLDLRGNGGGRLDQAVAVSSLFLSDGMIVATDGRSRRRTQYDAIKDAVLTADPLVVLVDKGSASASEITAGALKFRDRALVVGVNTFGKGVFQEVTELENGGAISLTVGRYVLPGNHYITKRGLTPDLKAEDDIDTRADEALDASFEALAEFK